MKSILMLCMYAVGLGWWFRVLWRFVDVDTGIRNYSRKVKRKDTINQTKRNRKIDRVLEEMHPQPRGIQPTTRSVPREALTEYRNTTFLRPQPNSTMYTSPQYSYHPQITNHKPDQTRRHRE